VLFWLSLRLVLCVVSCDVRMVIAMHLASASGAYAPAKVSSCRWGCAKQQLLCSDFLVFFDDSVVFLPGEPYLGDPMEPVVCSELHRCFAVALRRFILLFLGA